MNESLQPVRIMGVQRSGTNLAKYLLEKAFFAKAYFFSGWWKHAIIPPLEDKALTYRKSIIVRRRLEQQLISWYEYGKIVPNEMKISTPFPEFLRSPMVISEDMPKKISYWFPNPIAYYVQYYYSAHDFARLHPNIVKIIPFAELVENSASTTIEVGTALGLLRRQIDRTELVPPKKKLNNLWDGSDDENAPALSHLDIAQQNVFHNEADYYTDDDIAFIGSIIPHDIRNILCSSMLETANARNTETI